MAETPTYQMTEARPANYWMSSYAIYIQLNAAGDYNYIHANCSSGSVIMCHVDGINELGYDSGHNYRRWQLTASPTVFHDNVARYVYIAIPKSAAADAMAVVVFPSEKIDIYGKNAKGEQIGSTDYYYIFTQGIISDSYSDGGSHARTWTQEIDTGTLASDEALASGGEGKWWDYNSSADTVKFLKAISEAIINKLTSAWASIKQLVLNGHLINGVSSSSTPVTSDDTLVTPKYGEEKWLSKTHDDATEYKLGMGEAEVKGDASVKGHVLTDDIHSYDSDGSTAMTGRGWVLKNVTDESGTYSVLAVDNLVVRKKMEAAELEIHKKTYVGAQMIASDWGHKILRVDPVDYNKETGEITSIGMTLFTLPVTIDGVKRMVAFVGRQLSDTETRVELLGDGKGILNRELETTANAFKVYFCESDGTASIEDDLVVGTMGQCQEFNVKERVTHNFTNSYYWGVCLAHGVDEDVRIGDKSVPCVWGVFSHSTDILTLTSEVSGKTFTCYGMEQSRCTFPVAGDDMVGFGCADPWQDTDRCNAIITASKDGENSAPSVISYSGIGRKRGGSVVGTLDTSATPPAYLNIGEQYSIPTDKADSRLDFRISKKAGNVFKGDLYFRGDDGTPHVVGATYMLSADKSVVEYGGDLAVKVYKIIDGKAVSLTSGELSKAGLSVSLYRTAAGSTTDVTSAYSNLTWSHLTGNSSSFSNVVLSLKKGSETLDTMAVYLSAKALPQTEVWRLVAIKELAEINYDIDKDQYSNYAEHGETGDNTLDKVFVKSGNIALQYYILHQKGDDAPVLFSSMSGTDVGMTLSVTESGADGSILNEFSSDGGNVGATHLHDYLSFTDSSDDAVKVASVTVLLRKNGNVLDRREVRTSLATNGVADMNKKFLAYIYYGTSGDGGTQYVNKRLSDMEGNYNELSSWKETADGQISQNTAKITETADGLDAEISKREGAVNDMQTKLKATADGITTTVKSLYSDGNLLWGAHVLGMFRKTYKVYTSETIQVKAGITYTLTVKAWMRNNDRDSTKPYYTSHKLRIVLDGASIFKIDDAANTSSTSYIRRIVFTPSDDTNLDVTIYEIADDGTDPETYGGIYVDWLRIDMGDHSSADQYSLWEPAAEDVETINLLPDPGFSDAIAVSSMGASRDYSDSKKTGYMSKYTADTMVSGSYGMRMFRSGATSTSSDGLRYYVPFRGAGLYTLSAFFKNIGTVDSDGACHIDLYTCDQDKNRIGTSYGISYSPDSKAPGYEPQYTSVALDDVVSSKAVCWIELRVYMSRNGDVVVNRICLAKCQHRIDYNANNLSTNNQHKLATESYAYQRADSIGAGIRQGLKSVGFKMDSATWSVNTWGNRFSWYATEPDAATNDTSKAVMYLDSTTSTLHVKGYVEATGGKIGELELIDGDKEIVFEVEKDSNGNYVEKHKSAMSYKSIQFYIQHSDGRYSVISPVSWLVKMWSGGDNPGIGLQSVRMNGYGPYIPGHTVELLDNKTPSNLKTMSGLGIGYSTNGLSIAKAFKAANGGLAMVCKAYGRIKADGTFSASDQVNMSDTDCTVETVTRMATGAYRCMLHGIPNGLFTVFVRARVTKAGDNMYATLGDFSTFWFTVMTSDDASRNDSDFEYFVVSFGGY